MKNLLVLVIVALAGYLLFNRYVDRDPPPVRAYKKVAEAWAHGDLATLRSCSQRPEIERIFEVRTLANLSKPIVVGDIVKVEYSNVAATAGESSNEYTVKAEQDVYFNPAGVNSKDFASWRGVFEHTVKVREVAGEWKVASFQVNKKSVGEFRLK